MLYVIVKKTVFVDEVQNKSVSCIQVVIYVALLENLDKKSHSSNVFIIGFESWHISDQQHHR